MALSKLKTQTIARATRRFTDRDAPQKIFRDELDKLRADASYFSVLTFYGVGGIGKSSLLRQLEKNVNRDEFETVFVDLEASAYASPVDILLDIHRQLPWSCAAFEYAVAKYFSLHGQELKAIKKTLIKEDSLLFDLQEVACDLAEVVAPVRLLTRLVDLGYQRARTLGRDTRKLISDIDQLQSIEDVSQWLPVYLGMEIERRAAKKGQRLAFFVDSHETTFRRDIFRNTKHRGDAWLMEFAGATETGVFVITGRERIDWDDDAPEWAEKLDQHLLGRLSDIDADAFLRGVPIVEDDVRNAIVESAKGVPLFLDLCAQTYVHKKHSAASITEQDFRVTENRVIERFVAHLPREHADALSVMAVPEIFDQGVFERLLRARNIGFPLTRFTEFCNGSYAVELIDNEGIYKIHRIVRDYLHDECDHVTVVSITKAMLDCLDASVEAHDANRAIWLLKQVVTICSDYATALNDTDYMRLLRGGLWLIDRGRWLDVRQALAGSDGAENDTAPASHPARHYLLALCARKTGALREAQALFAEAAVERARLGEYRRLFDYHAAHATHLLGDFDTAVAAYETVVADPPSGAVEHYAYDLAARQLADVAMIRGDFRQALDAFSALRDRYDTPLWQAEVLRFSGHIYRFNTMYQEALDCYERARSIAVSVNADAVLGKTLTNLAETQCWTDPEVALETAARALDVNNDVSARIEVGKALAAEAIARAGLGDYEGAVATACRAADVQKASGYQNGVLFAWQAEGIAHYRRGATDRARDIVTEMDQLSKHVTVYGFLSTILKTALKTSDCDQAYERFDWLDTKRVRASHRAFIGRAPDGAAK